MEQNFYWLALSKIEGIGNKTLLKIFHRNHELGLSIADFLNLPEPEIQSQYGLKSQIARSIQKQGPKTVEAIVKKLVEAGIKTVTFPEKEYPETLREISNPPFILYYLGNFDLLQRKPVAITGSRNITLKGSGLVYEFTRFFVEQELTLIQGNRKEIDHLAHIAAEEVKGFDITVLSEGILTFLEKAKKKGIDMKRNIILSFVDPLLDWTAYGERERNRIIFALANPILITEAREHGIIMKEAENALSKGKKVYVVRYEKFPTSAKGNQHLIEKGGIPISPSVTLNNLREVIQSSKGEEAKLEAKGKPKKELGQFFTPIQIVEFMYEMVKVLWGDKSPQNPKIIDPACGEGIFLKYALDKGITTGENLYGCDIDETIRVKWNSLGIRNQMKLSIQDGLLDSKELGIEANQFDLVIGNPPYGGMGLGELGHLLDQAKQEKSAHLILFGEKTEEKREVREAKKKYSALIPEEKKKDLVYLANFVSSHYELWRRGDGKIEEWEEEAEEEGSLFPDLEKQRPGKRRADLIIEALRKQHLLGKERTQLHLSPKDLKKLITFPIEVIFVERFMQLAKPGGYVVIIVPDGLLANRTYHFVWKWILRRAQVVAVTSLPRETFKYLGTAAKTSVLILKKLQEGEACDMEKPIFMASTNYVGVGKSGKNEIPKIVEEFRYFSRTGEFRRNHNSPFFGKATARECMKVWRMDAEYWDPENQRLLKLLKKSGSNLKPIGELLDAAVQGDVPRKKYGERYVSEKRGIKFITAKEVRFTGLDMTQAHHILLKHHRRIQRSKPIIGDIIFVRSGVASAGRSTVFLSKDEHNVNSSIDVLRFKKINPLYVDIFLKTRFAQQQIKRLFYGVGTVNISVDKISTIQIPILPKSLQTKISNGYKKMSKCQDEAINIKKKLVGRGFSNKEAEKDSQYKKYIQKAESILNELIKRTVEVIEGKRKDI